MDNTGGRGRYRTADRWRINRRQQLVNQSLVEQLRAVDIDGATFTEALGTAPQPHALVRATLLHLLWRQDFTFAVRPAVAA
jgi:hypothetical protein